MGDNGAGKSTLIKVISGAVIPDRGEILLDGHPARLRSPQDAVSLGIMTVYQHLALIDTRDVLANLFLGREPSRWGMIDRRKMQEEATRVLCRVGDLDSLADGAGRASFREGSGRRWRSGGPCSGEAGSSSWTSRQQRSGSRKREGCWS